MNYYDSRFHRSIGVFRQHDYGAVKFNLKAIQDLFRLIIRDLSEEFLGRYGIPETNKCLEFFQLVSCSDEDT